MAFKKEPEPEPIDPTAWLVTGPVPEFLLMHTSEIKYMAMVGYTFVHGAKLFPTFSSRASDSFKFISMILRCTGGGILVPIFINSIPVPMAQDAYMIAIIISFILHRWVPMSRDVVEQSAPLKVCSIVLYETLRASIVVGLTSAAGNAIAPSGLVAYPFFGPIMCGTIAGCGGAFLPLNKGLEPIEKAGLGQPMMSSFVAASGYHLFVNTSLSDDVVEAPKKGHVLVAAFFIIWNLNMVYSTKAKAKKD